MLETQANQGMLAIQDREVVEVGVGHHLAQRANLAVGLQIQIVKREELVLVH